ncbi:MAG: SDR family NAD(P)-dependent oxidoreductase [Anaerolineae bacterium]|nr:SDR family NAD(P)-dependent oxidoreductase [Anaerolineae bacterium]
MSKRFEGKAVIVTGAAKGIGRAAALAFAREGGSVTIADVDGAAGSALAAEINASGGQAICVAGDIAQASTVQQVVAETVHAFGGVDVLYNNAGVVKYGTVVDMPVEDWDWIIGINLRASFLTCKYAIPEMRKRGGGAIVNTASVQAFASQQTVAAYAASKGGS